MPRVIDGITGPEPTPPAQPAAAEPEPTTEEVGQVEYKQRPFTWADWVVVILFLLAFAVIGFLLAFGLLALRGNA